MANHRTSGERAIGILSALVAARPLLSAGRGALWAASGGTRLRDAARQAFGRGSAESVPADLPDEPAARFAAMQRHFGISDAEVAQRCRAARFSFLLYLAASALMLAWAILCVPLHLAPFGLPIAPWAVFALFAAKTVRWSLLHHHLRNRRLTPLREWLRDPANVLMPLFDGGVPAKALRATATVLLSCLLLPATAWAQTAPAQGFGGLGQLISALTSDMAAGDLSLQWIYRIFPSVFSATGITASQDAVAGMLGLMNSLLVACASFMLVWETMSGVVHAAHTGKAFSERYHAFYAPLRVCIGMAGIVPVGGYCLAQFVVIYVALAGYKMANVVWTGYLGTALGMTQASGPGLSGDGRWAVIPGGGAVTVPPDLVAQLPALTALLSSETCYQAARWDSRTQGQSQTPPEQPTPRGSSGLSHATRPLFVLPPVNGTPITGGRQWDYGQLCGSITWQVRPATSADSSGTVVPVATDPSGAPYVTVPAETNIDQRAVYLQTFDNARADAFGTLVTAMRNGGNGPAALAAAMASPGYIPDGNVPDIAGKMTTVLTAYGAFKSSMLSASSTLSASLNQSARASMMTRAQSLGWAAAGAIQPAVVRSNATVVSRVMEQPSVLGPNPDSLSMSPNMKQIYGLAQAQLTEALYTALPDTTTSQRTGGGSSGFPEIDTVRDLRTNPETSLTTWLSRLSERVFVSAQGMAQLNPTDPLSSIQDHGQVMEAILLGGQATWMMINAAAGAGEKISDGVSASLAGWFGAGVVTGAIAGAIKGVVTGFAGFVNSYFWWALALAAIYSTVLPMLGYLFWVFAIVGCIVFLIEGVVGSAFWAFAHVRTDGSGEFVGPAQKHGYSILFNMAFRPSLMVIGLVMGHVAFAISAGFVNATFALGAGAAFSGEAVYGSRIMSPMSIIVLMCMLFYIHYQLAVRSYSLITQLPDRVARWSGASGENLGEEGHFEGTHSTIVGGVVRQTATAGQVARTIGNGNRQQQQDSNPTPGQPQGSVQPAPGSRGTSAAERTATASTIGEGGGRS